MSEVKRFLADKMTEQLDGKDWVQLKANGRARPVVVLATDYDELAGEEHTVDDAIALKTACLKYGLSVQESDEISPTNYRHMTRRLVDAVKRGFYEGAEG